MMAVVSQVACCGFSLLFFLFGLYGLLKGEIPLAGTRKVAGTTARVIGVVLILLGLLSLVMAGLSGVSR